MFVCVCVTNDCLGLTSYVGYPTFGDVPDYLNKFKSVLAVLLVSLYASASACVCVSVCYK